MPARRHSADLRGRRQDLGISVRDMAAGLGLGLGRLLSMEDGTASEEDKTFYRTWLSRIEGWPAGHRHIELQRARNGSRVPMTPLIYGRYLRAGDLIRIRDVQGVRGLRHDQQCFRWKRVVPDLLQLRDDFVLASGRGQRLPRLAPT